MKIILHIFLVSCFAMTAFAKGKHPTGSDIKIVSASYGFEQDRIVVTDLLRPLKAHGVLFLRAPWSFGIPDPKFGATKDVVIVYRHNGTEGTATFNQDQDILLPPPSKEFSIISASYGVPNSRIDATLVVRAAVKDGGIKLPVGWGLGRIDPAAGKIKTVEITYVQDGTVHTASFNQDQELVLP